MKVCALGSSLLLALAGNAPAQHAAPDLAPQATFRSGASLVAINVTVSDGKRFVGGLRAQDFEVYEDGVLQHVQFFESAAIPVDLILLLDTSASMRDKMAAVHEAALGFLATLRGGDRGAVVAFSDGVDVLQELTTERGLLTSAVKRAEAHGGTALHNALYVSMKQFGQLAQQNGEVRRQAIAVLSDGQDTASLISFDDVLALARQSGVNIYTIALQSESAEPRSAADKGRRFFSESDYSLKTLAAETGAQAFFPQFVQDLKGVYATIADELSRQYSIGYTPSNVRADGRFRRIVVKVASRPELRPRTRQGYTALTAAAASFIPQPR